MYAADLSITNYDTDEILFGGTGLMSKDGIPKPVFYAHQFMNMLASDLITCGDRYIVTADKAGGFKIIPYAQAPVGDLRWVAPMDPEPWEGVKACEEFGPVAWQNWPNFDMPWMYVYSPEFLCNEERDVRDPNGEGLPQWDKFDGSYRYMLIGDNTYEMTEIPKERGDY